MKLSFKDKIELEKYYGIVRVWFFKDGIKRTFYVQGVRADLEKLAKVSDLANCNISEYGEILATFDGEDEPAEITTYIESLLLRKAG